MYIYIYIRNIHAVKTGPWPFLMLPLQKAIHVSHCSRRFKSLEREKQQIRTGKFASGSLNSWHGPFAGPKSGIFRCQNFHRSELWTLSRRKNPSGGMRFLGRKQWSPSVPTIMVLVMGWAIPRPYGGKEVEVSWEFAFEIWDFDEFLPGDDLWFVWSYKPGCTQGGLTKTLVELYLARGTLRRFFCCMKLALVWARDGLCCQVYYQHSCLRFFF